MMYIMSPDGAMRIVVATTLLPHEHPELVVAATRKFFPDWHPEEIPARNKFPSPSTPIRMISDVMSLNEIIENCRKHRILDTALDAMTMNSEGNTTHFSLSRQAASVGRCSFVLEEPPVGGSIDVTVTRENLDHYLTELTYHPGREEFPRYPNDDASMNDDGSSSVWISKRRK
ncbi:MAG: hypothetical protein VYE10_03010 [Candidatus Thermoplasmatota archaeon]|nr:hypothetical protein [Candidatus Thermoplasmatota archaeon]